MAAFTYTTVRKRLPFRLSGALTKGAAAELEQAWLTARSTLSGRELLIDLGSVNHAGTNGQAVLRRLAADGARFITAASLTVAFEEGSLAGC